MSKSKTKDPNKLGVGRLLLWKSSDVSAGWVNVIVLNYLSLYASDTLGLNVAVVGTILLASKVIDAITDLFAGWIVDNTHTKLGKGRPYELSIIGMTVCTILMFGCRSEWSTTVKYVWLFFTYVFTYAIFATMRNAGATPYTIRAFSNNPVLIRKVASYGGIITMAGSMAVSIAFPIITSRIATSASGWTAAVALLMIPATLIGVLRFIFCKEDPSVDAGSAQQPIHMHEVLELFKRNKYVWFYAIIMLCFNLMTNLAAGSYFFKWIVGDLSMMSLVSVFSIVLLPLMFTFPKIMQKMGSMCKMVAMFGVISLVGYLIVFFSGSSLVGVFGGGILAALITLPLSYYGVLFIMDICTYNEMIGLPRMDGSSGVLSGFASKVGGAMGSWVTGILLMLAGYVSAEGVTEQPASALMMIRIDYSIVPAICVVIIIVCVLAFEKLEKMIPEFEAKKKAEAEAAKTEPTA